MTALVRNEGSKMMGETSLKACVLMSIFLLGMVCTAAAGRTIYVDADANGINDGASWTDSYRYLQDALSAAVSGDEIWVAHGIYKPDANSANPSGTGDRYATFQLVSGVALKGGYAGFGQPDPNVRDFELNESILSGDLDGNDVEVNDPCDLLNEPTRAENSYHVLNGSGTDPNAILDGFTITGGYANGSDRQNRRGGGMYNTDSSVTILSCAFKWNLSRGWGGGLYNSNSRSKLINCTFIGNSRSGMYNYESALTLTRCTFRRNLTPYYGGGIFNDFGTQITLIECIFRGNNSYKEGGGIFNNYGSLSSVLTNCIFVGNHAGSYGGGIFNGLNELLLTNCTFVGNSAGDEGGGLFIPPLPSPSVSSSSTAYYGYSIITNCIFWDNLPEQIVDLGSVISVVYSDIQGSWPGVGNIDDDPFFADLNNGDCHLKSQAGRWDPDTNSWVLDDVNSPCIDVGDPTIPIGNEPFPNGGVINMGAYGGTAEASKSYFGRPPCEIIIAGDINGDCKVNWFDFQLMALHWLEDNSTPPPPLPP
ncbi:MAG: hypothetical protein FVQ85_08695 [Planctomycetes bacterium]|nr:hypothetical protein [Planctomycetota bacterium]